MGDGRQLVFLSCRVSVGSAKYFFCRNPAASGIDEVSFFAN